MCRLGQCAVLDSDDAAAELDVPDAEEKVRAARLLQMHRLRQ